MRHPDSDRKARVLREHVVPYGAAFISALLALALVASLEISFGQHPTAVLLYVIPVVLAASRWGRGPAMLAALVVVLGQDVLFIEPRGMLTIASPDDALGLGLLGFVAVLTAHLADSARRGAEHAQEAEVAQRSDALKTALLRAVSHDLRTPLASIKASASGLIADQAAYTAAERQEVLQAIEEEADHLDRLVGNLLDASQVEAGALQSRKSPQDVAELVQAVIRRYRPLLAGRAVTLVLPEDLPSLLCDRSQVAQALSNIVENVAVHTPAGTAVRVTAAARQGAIAITVEDQGPGIPPGDRQRLFRPFERGAGAPRGTGLGLAIARGYAEAHGGGVNVEEAPAGGARLVLTIPLGKDERSR